MKKFIIPMLVLLAWTTSLSAQNRAYSRGADSGEWYLNDPWYGIYDQMYGPPYYETLRMAIYHITENGKKLTIQYDADYFANPETTMVQGYIPADATPGVLYAKCFYSKNSYPHTSLWISSDYGKNWTFREENEGNQFYYSANVEGVIYRSGGESSTGYGYKSIDYGEIFNPIETNFIVGEPGLTDEEFFFLNGSEPYQYQLLHTHNSYNTYIEIPIDGQYVFGLISSIFPDVYRGGKEGEIYVSSWFPDNTYKISFSADTGYTFRHVYISDVYPPGGTFYPKFMSDRESGVFYIFQRYEVPDTDPLGWHIKICIDYYRDYGEILEATFCHDLTKEYEYEEITCNHTTNLNSEIINTNSIQLQWSNTADNIRGYHVYRNSTRITSELLTNTTYLDENLPNGVYEYYVRAYYQEGCVSDSSNHILERIGDETCDSVDDLTAEKINDNSVLLTWTKPENDLQIEKYSIFRNNIELAEHVTSTSYLDENLPNGSYEYYVVAHYTNGCISDSSNHVNEIIGVGIVEMDNYPSLQIFPNPTQSEMTVATNNPAVKIVQTEIYDFTNRKVHQQTVNQSYNTLRLNELAQGVYILKVWLDNGDMVVRKVVKQ